MNAKPWTQDDDALLAELFPHLPGSEVAERMRRTRNSVNLRAQKLGIRKAADYVPPGRFPPGHVPYHAGRKRPEARIPTTAFRTGQKPQNWLPIGSYRVSAGGYLDRKVADTGYSPRDWQPVHRLVWEAAHGPIPDTHCVCFRPGRHSTRLEDITVDALECMPKGEHNARNWHWAKYPREVAELIHLRGTVNPLINKHTKEQNA